MANPITSSTKRDIENTKDEVRNTAQEVTSDLRDFAERAGTNVREFLSNKSEQADKVRKSAEDTIVSHPIKSVVAAAVGGMILSAILRRL